MIDVALAELVGCLELRNVDDDLTDEGVFEADNLDIGYHRVFGGQILAQLIVAATRVVPDKSVKSLHVLFPREGDASRPLRYRVSTRHAGRTFAALQIVVAQEPDERVVAVATVSMHIDEDGLEHGAVPPHVGGSDNAVPQELDLIPWEVRVAGGVDLADRSVGPARFDWWMRSTELDGMPHDVPAGTNGTGVPQSRTGPAGSDRAGTLDQALLAYATDLTVIGTALRPIEGLSQADSTVRIATAVTSHTLWFHRPFAVSDWLQLSQEAPVMAGARAFGRGDVFSGDVLVASFAQESMVRPIEA